MAAHALDRHIALIGFMGAGKTTLGAELAERLGRPFVDVDREVEQVTGRSIADSSRRAARPGSARSRSGSTGVDLRGREPR